MNHTQNVVWIYLTYLLQYINTNTLYVYYTVKNVLCKHIVVYTLCSIESVLNFFFMLRRPCFLTAVRIGSDTTVAAFPCLVSLRTVLRHQVRSWLFTLQPAKSSRTENSTTKPGRHSRLSGQARVVGRVKTIDGFEGHRSCAPVVSGVERWTYWTDGQRLKNSFRRKAWKQWLPSHVSHLSSLNDLGSWVVEETLLECGVDRFASSQRDPSAQ